jgi:hypothetical protein
VEDKPQNAEGARSTMNSQIEPDNIRPPEAQETQIMYRYDCWFTGGYTDDDGYATTRQAHLSRTIFRVIKRTEKGVWVIKAENGNAIVSSFQNEPRFVLTQARKRRCYETEEQALKSFIARKKKQAHIYAKKVTDLKDAVALAEHQMESRKAKANEHQTQTRPHVRRSMDQSPARLD